MNKTRNTRFWNNLEKKIYDGVGLYGIPEIKPEKWEPCDFIAFDKAKMCTNRNDVGVHFFLDDYLFDRIWNQFDRYMKMLSYFKAVLSPDWSLYTDWPTAVNIWSHYRKHYVGAYLQDMGVKVYPTIEWSDRKSIRWCFDGEPVGSCVAISSVGTQRSSDSKRNFLYGYYAMIERLAPETILFWGNVPKECSGNIVRMEALQEKIRKKAGDNRSERVSD